MQWEQNGNVITLSLADFQALKARVRELEGELTEAKGDRDRYFESKLAAEGHYARASDNWDAARKKLTKDYDALQAALDKAQATLHDLSHHLYPTPIVVGKADAGLRESKTLAAPAGAVKAVSPEGSPKSLVQAAAEQPDREPCHGDILFCPACSVSAGRPVPHQKPAPACPGLDRDDLVGGKGHHCPACSSRRRD